MQDFTTRHQDVIHGVLHGFDRLIFRGTLRSISYPDGLGKYMNHHGILLKDFDGWAQRCTGHLRDHLEGVARAAGVRCEYLPSSAISKEERALAIAEEDGLTEGLVCVLSCVEPCMSPVIRRNAQTKRRELRFTPRKCKFYYLYLIDPVFGWMHIRIQTWLPFEVQVYINGRTYLHRQLERAGIGYRKAANSFTWIEDVNQAQGLLDRLGSLNWPKQLKALVNRYWPKARRGLPPGRPGDYYWTIRQSEVATDVMFDDVSSLASVYRPLCRYAMEELGCQDILRFMGKSPSRHRGPVTGSCVKRVQGVRIKHTVDGCNSIKMYDKQGSVLRIETTINDPRKLRVYRGTLQRPHENCQWRPMSKSVADIGRRLEVCRQANQRYLSALAVAGRPVEVAAVLDPVSKPVVRAGKRQRGLRAVCPEDAALFAAVMDGRHLVNGLTNGSMQALLYDRPPRNSTEAQSRSNAVGRKLRLLRQHGLIRKIGSRRLYRVTPKGHQVMGLALALRQYTAALPEAA